MKLQVMRSEMEVQAMQGEKTYTREEFRKLVKGKTKEELVSILGKPGSTHDFGGGGESWTYYNLTVDPATGNVDPSARIELRGGIAGNVDF